MSVIDTPRNRARAVALTGAAVVAALGLAACSEDKSLEDVKPSSTSSTAGTSAVGPSSSTAAQSGTDLARKLAHPTLIFGGEGNVFAQDISKAPVDPGSAAKLKNLRSQITPHWGGVAAFNAYRYNSSLFVADASTPKVRVAFDNCQSKPDVPPDFYAGQKIFMDVPIPKDAVPSTGTDAAMAIWDPSQDKFWEFWVAKKNAKGQWSACYGGRIDGVSTNKRADFPYPYGTSASGLATAATSISVQEAKDLRIEHAIYLGLMKNARWDDVSYPANRSDGTDESAARIPIGTRIRLDPSVDVDTLPMGPLGKAVARAAQKYGFLVSESAGAVGVATMSGNAEERKSGKNPWDTALHGAKDYDVLKGFPWDKVQFIQKDWGKPAGVQR